MFNTTEVIIDAFEERLRKVYASMYTNLEPSYPGIISYVAHMSLELIANSDASFHDLGHTINVTLVGQDILKGKHLRDGGVSPKDWLNFTIALLCHDIGYVRGICNISDDTGLARLQVRIHATVLFSESLIKSIYDDFCSIKHRFCSSS